MEVETKFMEREIIQTQLALFFQSDFTGNFEELSLKLKAKFGESKITQHIPIPTDAPSEIPRLILGYENFNLNISKNRLDLFFKDINSVKTVISSICDVLLVELSLSVGRIGFVKNFFIDGNIEDLKQLLVPKKIKKIDLKEINIRANEKKIISDYECNNIENLSNGYVIKREIDGSEKKRDGIIITRDINTVAEKIKENKFEKEEINNLIDIFNKESGAPILYFDNSADL